MTIHNIRIGGKDYPIEAISDKDDNNNTEGLKPASGRKPSINDAKELLRDLVEEFGELITELPLQPDAFSLEVGIGVDAKAGVILANFGGSAAIKAKVDFKVNDINKPKNDA